MKITSIQRKYEKIEPEINKDFSLTDMVLTYKGYVQIDYEEDNQDKYIKIDSKVYDDYINGAIAFLIEQSIKKYEKEDSA